VQVEGEQMLETISIAAGIASLVLSILAISLSAYFYTQTKNTEKDVAGLLEGIRAQTDALQRIVGRQMDRLIRGVTEQPEGGIRIVYEVLAAIKEIPGSVTNLLQQPSSAAQAAQQWYIEAIKGYIGAYYYAALANIAHQYYLPPLDQLQEGDILKRIVDTSHADFVMLDNWFATLDAQELRKNPLWHLYSEAHDVHKTNVKESTMVYQERAATARAQSH
jgi:hypothetical protein